MQGAQGPFVWAVNSEEKAEFRMVTLGDWHGDDWFISEGLKAEITDAIRTRDCQGFACRIRLFFMGRSLPVHLSLTRLWRTGSVCFSAVDVNEHAHVDGAVVALRHEIEHRDSPNLEHWINKQNRYTTSEAIGTFKGSGLADKPRLLGNALQRRMWVKKHYRKIPFRYFWMFLYHYLVLGAWQAGWVGYAWSRLRCDVYRLWEYKLKEIQLTGRLPVEVPQGPGRPDARVPQYD
jgi:hypothetical protein